MPKEKSSKQTCRFCKSPRTVRRGLRYNEKKKKQLFLCTHCHKKFTADDGYLRMRHDEKIIKYAIDQYGRHSSAQVKRLLEKRGVHVSRWTIIKWTKKYTGK